MIECYTWTTPNGRKIPIALDEMGLAYELKPVDLRSNEQKSPAYLRINPNGKIPAIIDRDAPGGPVTVFESGAILIYLAEKSGKLLPKDPQGRMRAIEWVFFQVGGVGPMFGQAFAYGREKDKHPEVAAKFAKERDRILGVLDGRLGEAEYLAGEYSIADVCTYPWVQPLETAAPEALAPFANVRAWLARVGERPAVKRGMALVMSPHPPG